MPERCYLRASLNEAAPCDLGDCVYFRALEMLGEKPPDGTECILEHFNLLEQRNPKLAGWFLSLRERLEGVELAQVQRLMVGRFMDAPEERLP